VPLGVSPGRAAPVTRASRPVESPTVPARPGLRSVTLDKPGGHLSVAYAAEYVFLRK